MINGGPAVFEGGEVLVQLRVLGHLEGKIYIIDRASAWGQVLGFDFGLWTSVCKQGVLTLAVRGLLGWFKH